MTLRSTIVETLESKKLGISVNIISDAWQKNSFDVGKSDDVSSKKPYLWSAKADKTIFRARGFNFFKFRAADLIHFIRARGLYSFYFARANASTWQNCFNFVLQRYVL